MSECVCVCGVASQVQSLLIKCGEGEKHLMRSD